MNRNHTPAELAYYVIARWTKDPDPSDLVQHVEDVAYEYRNHGGGAPQELLRAVAEELAGLYIEAAVDAYVATHPPAPRR